MVFALKGASVFTGEEFLNDHAVMVEDHVITAVIPSAKIPASMVTHDLEGGVLAPGFIDIQVNGGGGALLNDLPDVAAVQTIARSHRKFGTTGLLPTVITDRPAVMLAAIDATRAAQRVNPAILGIHIEGPFIDLARKGAHAAEFIRPLTEKDVELLVAHAFPKTLITLAPNRTAPELIRQLTAHGILVSLGHSDASGDEVKRALAAGATCFTHLFNAMSQLTGRSPGMAGVALSSPFSFAGIIADGFHVDDTALKVALAAKGSDQLILVTDAMPTAAGGPDRFMLQGREVLLDGDRLQLADGTLAGSNLTMDAAVRYCVNRLLVPLDQALKMASSTPARFLGLEMELGFIKKGYKASLVHLDQNLGVRNTWVEGQTT